jgi:hypothetical protein
VSGYVTDTVLTLVAGDVVVIQATQPTLCDYPYPSLIYSKFIIDSIKPAARSIHLRAVTDPNCGFRSFSPGIPVD